MLPSQNSFFVKLFFYNQDSFFVEHIKFKKRKELKKDLSEVLMAVAWHPHRWWDGCMSEDEKKEINPMFIEKS